MSESDENLIEIEGVPDFWERLAPAGDSSLVLDYDGTLAPFHVDRMRALPLDGVVELLTRIRDAGRTHLSIMTGRPMKELLALLGDLDIPVSASQGTEFRFPDGTLLTLVPTQVQEERLARALEEARAIAPDGRVERKIASVAMHTRGVDPEQAKSMEDELCSLWEEDANDHNLECRRFLGGVELRLDDIDKGTALEKLLERRPDDDFCVYVGDDYTDEDALEVLVDRGIGIKVGSPEIPTHARGRLADPCAVREFLKGWVRTAT